MSEDKQLAEQLSAIMRQNQGLQDRLYDLAEKRDHKTLNEEVSKAIGKPVNDGPGILNVAYILLTPPTAYDAAGD